MKFIKKFFILFLFLIPGFSFAQEITLVAEEWHIYDNTLKDFKSEGEKLMAVTFDSLHKVVTVSHGEFITRKYEVHSIESKELEGETVVYWNLRDALYLRIAIVPDMIMFINRDGGTGMVLSKLTVLNK